MRRVTGRHQKKGKNMASGEADNPNPPCPACGSSRVYELTYSADAEPGSSIADGWNLLEGACDVRPDRWFCDSCDFRWYPRKQVEQDLDMLTWQIARPDGDTPVDILRERLAELRGMISILARPAQPD